jgi:hypothetical protein
MVLVALFAMSADAAPGSCPSKIDASETLPDLPTADCASTEVQDPESGLEVALPVPGEGVYMEVLTMEGPEEFGVVRSEDGKDIEVDHEGADAAAEPVAQDFDPNGVPPACEDDRRAFLGSKVYDSIDYRINLETTPGEITKATTQDAIVDSFNRITTVKDQCELPDNVSAEANYLGHTALFANVFTVNGTRSCGPPDGNSVVSFGQIDPGALAATCNYSAGLGPDGQYQNTVESDIEFNRQDFEWTNAPFNGECSNDHDVESVGTHEVGHTFGLWHPTTTQFSQLTMAAGGISCTEFKQTLGLGDVLGLEDLY